jgi:hypothetical protein
MAMDTSLLPSFRDSFVTSCVVIPFIAFAIYLAPRKEQEHINFNMDQIKRYCQPPGVILPPPVNVTSPPSFISDDLFKNEAWYNSTTFAIKASLGDVSLIDYQHRAASNASTSYAKSLFDTKFRLGSVTKVFTVLAVLLSSDKIGFEDSIAKYISGLDATVYKDVTISALASHTSNLGRFVCTT